MSEIANYSDNWFLFWHVLPVWSFVGFLCSQTRNVTFNVLVCTLKLLLPARIQASSGMVANLWTWIVDHPTSQRPMWFKLWAVKKKCFHLMAKRFPYIFLWSFPNYSTVCQKIVQYDVPTQDDLSMWSTFSGDFLTQEKRRAYKHHKTCEYIYIYIYTYVP
jgi:hypothetical protein